MASLHPIRKVVAAPEIPDKLYFRIGEVAKLCGVEAYVLRFWETEFPQLKPNKGGTGQRLYRRRDVEMALRIKQLLYGQGFTIPGARQVLKDAGGMAPEVVPAIAGPSAPATKNSARHEALEQNTRGPLVATPGGPRRSDAMTELRSQMQALHAMLNEAVGEGLTGLHAVSALESGTTKGSKIGLRLVESGMPVADKAELERLAAAERRRLAQGDLFGGE